MALLLEILEDRSLLSTVHWSAAGSGDWNTAANWDAGRVPGAADDVVINAPGNITVTHSGGDHTVHSLQSTDALVLSGGSLTVAAGASQISGALTVTGATLSAAGAGTSFTATGTTSLTGASLFATGGATLTLPATSYTGGPNFDTTLQASDPNSKLDLSHVATLKGAGMYADLNVRALGGGKVDLSGVTSYPTGRTGILADGTNSVVDLSQLPKLISDANWNSGLEARNGGTVKVPLLTTLNRVDLTVNANATLATRQITAFTGATITDNGATPDFSGLTSIDGLTLVVTGGGTLAFPGVTSYAGANYDTLLQASDPGSKLDLSHLTTLKGGGTYNTVSVRALGGGKVDLSAVTSQPNGRIVVLADGTNSIVDLSQAPKLISDGYWNSALEARNNGAIKMPLVATLTRVDVTINTSGTLNTHQLTTFSGATLTDNGAAPDFTSLTNADGSSLRVFGGGTLTLAGLSGYAGANYDTILQAGDANSKLDLSHVTTLRGALGTSNLAVTAQGGGRIDLSGVTSDPGGRTSVLADGANSVVDLSRLPKLVSDVYWFSGLEARPGGAILTPMLTTITRVDLKITGTGTVDTHALTNADGSSLWVYGGGTLALPALTSYAGAAFGTTFQATDANSKLDLSHLTRLTGANSSNTLNVQGLNGARLDLSGVTSNPGGSIAVLADGANSVLDLSRLPRLGSDSNYNSSLQARHSGTISVPALTALSRVDVTLDGSSAAIGTAWTTFVSGTLTVSGGSYTLPKLADFITSNVNLQGGTLSFSQGTVTTIANLSTGLDATGKRLTTGGQLDANWTVQEANGTTGAAQTVFPNNPDFGSWPANGPTSDWIARDASNPRQGPAPYTFTRTFDLTGYDLSTVSLAGGWSVDDTGNLAINGHLIDREVNGWNNFATFLVSGASGFLNQGLNTLTMTITDSDNNVDGVHLDALLTTSGGLAAVVSSSVTVAAGATVNLPAGRVPLTRTDLNLNGGTVTTGTIELVSGSTLNGSGTVTANVLSSGGQLRLAGSAGILQIGGDYTQTANGTLTTNIGGAGGGQFGRFAVTGNSTLDGTLNINLVNGYYPANGTGFQVVTSGTVAGQFATTNGLTQNGRRTFQPFYRSGSFALVTVLDDLYPDLQVTGLATNPASGLHSGSNLTISWSDSNTGKAATPTGANWSDRVVVRNLTTGQTLLNTTILYDAVNRGPIGVNASQAQQYAYTLPTGPAGAGMIEIDVTVNTFFDVFEFNDAGTADTNNTTTITRSSTLFFPSPDLRVENLGIIFAAGLRQSGASVTVTWDDANRGNTPTSGSFTDTVVVTNTTTGKTIGQLALPYLESASGNGSIAVNDHRTRQVTLTLPDGADAVGNLAFTVTTDAYNQITESDHSHNTATTTAAVTLAPYADLTVMNLRVTQPATLTSGAHVLLGWDDANVGTGGVPVSYIDSILVQKVNGDSTFTTIAAGSLYAPSNLMPGASNHLVFGFDLPNGTAGAGQFRISVTTDAGNQVKRYDRQGNPATDNTSSLTASSALAAYADLKPANVSAPNYAYPGQPVTLTYTVSNTGTADAGAPWTDSVYLSTSPTGANPVFLQSFRTTTPLAAGASRTVMQTLTMPNTGLDGQYYFVVTVNSGGDVIELDRTNNTAVAAQATLLPQTITLALPVSSVSETGVPFQAAVTRSGSPANPLTLYLNIQDTQGNASTGHLSVPASVTIPAGQATAFFTVTPVWDHVVTGTLHLVVEAQTTTVVQPSTLTATAPVDVLDVDKPAASLSFIASQLSDGQATQGTVQLNPASVLPVTVTLTMNVSQQLSFPTTLTIPAGQTTGSFSIMALDLPDMQVNHTVVVTASVAGYVDGTAALQVIHNHLVNLTVTAAPGQFLENALGTAAVGTVTRSVVTPRDLVVDLASSLTTAARVPAQVVIPANTASVQFPIYAVDDPTHQFKPTRTVTITANATDPFTGELITRGAGTTSVQVLNAYGPTFTLKSDRTTIPQSGSAVVGTVTRNTGTTGAVVVTLASSDTTAATVPTTVTIPDGVASATFPIRAVDTPTNGNRVVTITANATGFSPGAFSITVTDIHLPQLRVTTITAPATALTGRTFSVSWTVANEGLLTAGPAWVDRVYLATQPTLTADAVQLGQYAINGNLAVGQQYSWTANGLQLPTIPGTYYVIVNTDATNAILQVDRTANTLVAPQPLVVAPSYHATVASAVRQSVAGQPVTLRGRATLADTGMPAAYSVVTVFIRHAGTSRPFAALTDANGSYTLNFQPLPGEGGDYQVGADHPGVPDATVPNQDSFTIIGMKAVPPAPSPSLVAGKSVQGTVQLTNLSNVALTNIQATLQGKPANLNIQVTVASSLPGNAMTNLAYTIQATDASVPQAAVTINLSNDQGATLSIPLNVSVVIPTPHLTGPAILKTGMVRGEQATWEFSVTNDGGAPTGPIQLAVPQAPWLTLATPQTMPSLDPGQSANIDLVLSPSSTLPLGPYTGTIGLNYAGTGLGLPFSFNNISSAVGDVQVQVVDENTYYGTNKTGLANANVSLLSPFDGTTIVSGVTDANGNITLTGVHEGAYNLQVTAAKHDGYKATFMVSPGQLNTQTVFLRTQLVTYNWQVQSTDVQDQTNVTLVTTFTTVVPVPVVTIDPGVIDLATITGSSGTVNLTVTNHGLIAARNVKLNFPTNANWKFTPLVSDIGDLAANSSLTIPVMIQRLGNGPQGADGGGCNIQAELDWTLLCGPFGVTYPVPIFILNVSSGCGGGGGRVPVFGGGIGGGLWGPVGTYYSPPPSCKCDPNNFHQQGVKGEVGFSVSLFEGWINRAINSVLAAARIPLSIEGIEFKASVSGEIDTCCKDGVQGLKAKASGSIGVEAKARLGVSLPVLPTKTIYVAGLGDVEVEASVFGGVEFTVKGEFEGEYETECNFANPKLKVSGKLGLEAFAGLIAKAEDKYTDPITHQTYGGGLEGKVGVSGEGSISISGGTDEGIHGTAELGPVKFVASYSGELSVGNKKFSVEASYEYTIYQGGSGGDSPGGGNGNIPGGALPSLASIMPAPLTVARLMQLNGFASVANLVQGFTGAPLPFPVTDKSSLTDISHAIEASFETGHVTLQGNVHYASLIQGDNQPPPPSGDDGVCAQVQLQIDQQAVVTRKAVGATLDISNASTTDPVQNLYVSITIYDAQGNDATDKFVIQPPKLTNLTVTNDGSPPAGWDETKQGPWTGLPSWLLAPGANGSASWIILPTDAAAPDGPVVYRVGGSFTYVQAGVPHSILLLPGPVTVYPNPQLDINYFLQRDVYAQDPFVTYTQPSVPFALGVLVTNSGKSVAQNFHIVSAQPKIVENYKGLQINFQIIGTQVAGKNFSPSLTADFGDIQPGQTAVGEWLFTSSLQGHFINYTAMFTNGDGLGRTGASVFHSVAIHEMIHVVKPIQVLADGLPGFLVNDLPTDNNLPDTIYLDNGTKAPVTQATNGQFDHAPTPTSLQVQVTATMQAGWSYLQMPDPANGKYHLVRIVRSDGFVLPVDDDAWVTDRTFGLDPTARPTYENILHLIDFNSTGRYTFYYAPNDTTPPMIQQLAPITSPRITAVDEEDVTLSKAIDPTTFTRAALVLMRDGGTNLITTAVTVTRLSDTVYAIRGLAGLTGTDGVYHLIVSAAGLQDPSGNAGTGSLDITWTMAAQAPTVVSITGTPALRNTPVSSLVVTFNKPIDLTTFDYHVLSLTLNNGPNLITSAVTVTQTGASTYQINGLNLLTGTAGQYVFSIRVTAIKDQMGHLGTGAPTLTWTVDTTPPTLAAGGLATVASPRNTTVSTLDVTFSKPINLATLTYRALTLTRNGGANLITPAVTITWVFGSTYRINDLDVLQAADGTYVLTVDAGTLQDAAGNTGQGTAMRSWVINSAIPAAPTNLVVVPSGSGMVRNGVSSTLSITLSGSLGAAGLMVHLYDATAQASLPDATVTGTSFSRALVFATSGAHRIQVQAADAAGNVSSPAFFDLFIDMTPPTVSQVVGVVPAARRTSVASVDVVFNKPIDPTTFDYHQLTLTRNGGANLITSAVQVALVSGATYRISGLSALTAGEGVYVLTVSAVGIKDLVANQGTGSASTQWINDQTPPQSTVLPLPAQALTQSFLVQWTGTDRPSPGGSGIASFNIYVSLDGGAFSVWQANTTVTSATFTGLTGHRYGFYSVATDNAGNVEPTPIAAQTSTLVTTGASGFRITPSVNPAVAGTAFTITVSARDDAGNVVPGFTGLVHFTSTDPAGTLPGDYTFTAADRGVHTFNVTLKTAGSRSLGVAAGVLTGSAPLTVNPAAASRLTLGGFPTSVTAGTVGMVTVTAFDPYGNVASGYTGTLHFTSTDGQAALPANYTFLAADQGVHTFNVTLRTAGSWTVTATDTVTGSLTATQSGITVTPAATSRLTVAGFPASVTAGVPGTATVTALDAYGNLTPAYRGSVRFSSTDLQAVLPGNYTFLDADNGVHTFTGLILMTAATQSITATDTATGSITGTQSGILVSPAATSALAVAGFPSPATAGVGGMVTVTAVDPFGNATPTYRGTVHFTSSDALAVLPADYTFLAADNGVHTFSGVVLSRAATQSITATDTAMASFTGTQSGIVVNPAAADHFQLTAPMHHRAGCAFALTVTALDPYGNVDVNYTGTVTFGSSDLQALLPADYAFTAADAGVVTFGHGVTLFVAGPQTLTATDAATGQLVGDATVLVHASAADHFQVDAPATSVAGQAFDLTVTALDPYGNIAVNFKGTITFSSTEPQAGLPSAYTFTRQDQGVAAFAGGATLFRAGSQTVSVAGSATVLVTPAAADHFQLIAPSHRRAGSAFTLTLSALDPYGNVDVNYTGTVTFGSSDPQALLPADYTFTAEDQGVVRFNNGATLFLLGSQTITVVDQDTGLLSGTATVLVNSGQGGNALTTDSPDRRHGLAASGLGEPAGRDRFFEALAGEEVLSFPPGSHRRRGDGWFDNPLM
jgi:hypothetical protein